MQTGIDFFDAQEPKPGDLWIVASGPGMGKSTLLRNLTVGVADHLPDGRIAYWDLEQTYSAWQSAILKMRPDVPASFDYRNSSPWQDGMPIVEALNNGTSTPTQVVAIDHFDLFTDDPDTGLKMFKLWLVRTGRFGIVSMRLPAKCWRQTANWDSLDPSTLPEPILDNGTAVFWTSKTSQKAIDKGVADTLRVVVAKTPTGLRDPSHHHAFIWQESTGRIL
jgi:hypothetical protein